jgi:hypothetical protein
MTIKSFPVILLSLILFSTVQSAQAQSSLKRKTNWTVAEVKEWIKENKNSTWQGMLLYQGSDTATHHFISRINDEWVWFNIRKAELQLTDERPYQRSSSSALGYYYADGLKDFIKIKDYK